MVLVVKYLRHILKWQETGNETYVSKRKATNNILNFFFFFLLKTVKGVDNERNLPG